MWWIISIPVRAARLAGHGSGNSGAHIQHPSAGISSPPASHGPSGILIILLVLVALVVLPVLAGMLMALVRRPGRSEARAEADPDGLLRARCMSPMTPVRGSTRELRIAVSVFQSPCDDCGAVRSQPCKLIPGVRTAVVNEDWNWVAHMSRIVRGCRENPRLYLALVGMWHGEVPGELKGMFKDDRRSDDHRAA